MTHYYCSHGKCKINGRKNPNAKFVTIPPRKSCPDRAKKWIDLMCRKGFTVDNITKNTKLCELHFPEDVDLDHRKNPTLEPYPDGYKRSEDVLKHRILKPAVPSFRHGKYKSCEHSDCASDSINTPNRKLAYFVLPKEDPIRAQRWVEMMCRKDFSLDDIIRAHRSKPNSPPDSVVCELHFEKDENLDYRTNLSLEPKPHRNCPPGFTPKANPVPKKWIEAAIKNLDNPFREKVIDYKNKTELCEIKQVSQPKIAGSLKIIVESVPPNLHSDPNQENCSIQEGYFQERHVQEFPDEQPEKVSEIGISNPNSNQDIKSQETLDDDNDIIMKNETSSGSGNSNDSEIIPESFEKIYFKKGYYAETLLQRKYEVSRSKVIIPNDDYEEIFGSGEYQSPDYKSGAIRIVLKSDLKKALKNNENIPFREKILGYINKSSLTFEDQIGKEVIKKRKLERPETNILQIHDKGVPDENIEEENTQEIPTQQESYKNLEIGVQSVQDQSAYNKIIQEYDLPEKQELEKGPNIVTEKTSVPIIDKEIGILGGKTYSRKLHSTATRPDKDIEIKLKLLKSFLDKPVVIDSTVDNNLKVTNQVLRKSLSNLLEIQRKSK